MSEAAEILRAIGHVHNAAARKAGNWVANYESLRDADIHRAAADEAYRQADALETTGKAAP